MKVKIHRKIQTIVICIVAFAILFSQLSVKATDSNKIYSVTTRDTTFQSTSTPGNPINATIMVPNGKEGSMPLVVMCHGYGGNRRNDGDHFIQLGTILAQNGIAAVSIDFPGCGDSTAAQSAYTQSNMYEYINTTISNMSSQYDIDSTKIGLTGHSMGGRIASLYTQNGSYSVAAVALWAPANGVGDKAFEFKDKVNFGYSSTFENEMKTTDPNAALRSFGGSIYLAIDGSDASDQGLICKETIDATEDAVIESAGNGEVERTKYADTDHNFLQGSGGRVVNETANFFGKLFLGREIAESDEDEEEEPLYTIEDVIFNRIPILDINFFSDTAGGQAVAPDSAVGVIRRTVSIWYVSFRNLVVIALAILIIYIGIRMALSTIPNDKAKYKTMLIGWIQSLVIILTIHYIMIVTININNGLVKLLEQAATNTMNAGGWVEDSIYETIRTRAYDFRLSVGLPGTIMYIALVMIWLKFLWVYIKRSFTILILVVIAPFIGAKYALDVASGKKGSSFSSWLYDFVLNVILQSIHAIIYTVLMTSALNFAFESLVGYIIALVFMNFMLEADDIFRNIFNFESKSSVAEEAARKEKWSEIKENFTGAMFVGTMASWSYGLAKGAGKLAGRGAKVAYDNLDWVHGAADGVANGLDSAALGLANLALGENPTRINDGKKKANTNKGNKKNKQNNKNKQPTFMSEVFRAMQKNAQLNKLSRQQGPVGIKARRLKNSINKNRKKRFKANIDAYKTAATGAVFTLLGAPMAVINPMVGAGMMIKGVNNLFKVKGKAHFENQADGTVIKKSEMQYAAEKYKKKRDKQYNATDSLIEINNAEKGFAEKAEAIRNAGIGEEQIDKYKGDVGRILNGASRVKIEAAIEDYIKANKITTIDNYSINDIIDAVAKDIGGNIKIDSSTRSIIGSKAKAKILLNKNKEEAESGHTSDASEPRMFEKADIVKAVQESVAEETVDKPFVDITGDLFTLNDSIGTYKKNAKEKYKGTNKYIDEL